MKARGWDWSKCSLDARQQHFYTGGDSGGLSGGQWRQERSSVSIARRLKKCEPVPTGSHCWCCSLDYLGKSSSLNASNIYIGGRRAEILGKVEHIRLGRIKRAVAIWQALLDSCRLPNYASRRRYHARDNRANLPATPLPAPSTL
jgi:hypothetical protein